MQRHDTTKQTEAETFWEGIYQKSSPQSGGNPGAVFERITSKLRPGRALDMGCAKGDDAVWLAKQGWHVTAVDVSTTALGYAQENARRAGVEHRVSFEQQDLSQSFPDGAFDLVYASFFYSPTPLSRTKIFRRAAESVVSGGSFLIIDHGSRAPWSWASADTKYPTATEAYQELGLSADTWRSTQVAGIERLATGPGGQQANVTDTVICLSRL